MEAIEQLPTVSESTVPEPTAEAEAISTIGSQMHIAGRIVCETAARIFGRIEGELRAADVLVGSGAHVRGELLGTDFVIEDGALIEGTVRGREVTVHGSLKGTIRATEVKLLGCAAVEGEIFHQRLSMEEQTQFEGTSRMVNGDP